MRKHQQLRLGVGSGADRGWRQPRVTNLAGVWNSTAVRWMVLRPGPVLYVPKTRRADDRTISEAYGRKRQSRAGISPGERRLNVFFRSTLALRHRSPSVERTISPFHCRYQSGDVVFPQRFQANVPAFEYKVPHVLYYA